MIEARFDTELKKICRLREESPMSREKTDRNEDKPWSQMDLDDLENAFRRGKPVAEIAELLMRREDEVWRKIVELNLKAAKQE